MSIFEEDTNIYIYQGSKQQWRDAARVGDSDNFDGERGDWPSVPEKGHCGVRRPKLVRETLHGKGVKGRVSVREGVEKVCACVRACVCARATGSSACSKATIALKANSNIRGGEEETGVSVAQWGIPSKGWDLVCQNCGSGLLGGGFHPSI